MNVHKPWVMLGGTWTEEPKLKRLSWFKRRRYAKMPKPEGNHYIFFDDVVLNSDLRSQTVDKEIS